MRPRPKHGWAALRHATCIIWARIRRGARAPWGRPPPPPVGSCWEKRGGSRLRSPFDYGAGLGSVVVKNTRAEPEVEGPGQPLRWGASGKEILNNKAKPVKKYEPFFSKPAVGHRFEDPPKEG